jgi:hypothetical protein
MATCCALAATIALITRVVHVPEPVIAISRNHIHTTEPENDSTTDQQRQPSREEFSEYLDRPLRQAFYDPPPPTPEVKQLPPLQVELLGTIIEPENSMAIVRTDQGSVQYKRVGDCVGPADSPASVLEIQADAIVLERATERLTLKVRGGEVR